MILYLNHAELISLTYLCSRLRFITDRGIQVSISYVLFSAMGWAIWPGLTGCLYKASWSVWMQWLLARSKETQCIFWRKLSFIWRQASPWGACLKKWRLCSSRLEFPIFIKLFSPEPGWFSDVLMILQSITHSRAKNQPVCHIKTKWKSTGWSGPVRFCRLTLLTSSTTYHSNLISAE